MKKAHLPMILSSGNCHWLCVNHVILKPGSCHWLIVGHVTVQYHYHPEVLKHIMIEIMGENSKFLKSLSKESFFNFEECLSI